MGLHVILILLLLGGGVFYFCGWVDQNGSNQRYRMVRVESGAISSSVTATGTINPVVTVLVGSQVSGTIKALYADFNSRVKEGISSLRSILRSLRLRSIRPKPMS